MPKKEKNVIVKLSLDQHEFIFEHFDNVSVVIRDFIDLLMLLPEPEDYKKIYQDYIKLRMKSPGV